MNKSKIILFCLVGFVPYVEAKTTENNQPCMNIPHTDEVISCMIDLAKAKKESYINEYKIYISSINTKEERSFDKKLIYKLVEEARKNWDLYNEKECLAEASVYEEDNYSFNDTYNACLIRNYSQRIEYYRNNRL